MKIINTESRGVLHGVTQFKMYINLLRGQLCVTLCNSLVK